MRKQAELPAAFADLGVQTRFLKGLAHMGFDTPSDIQTAMIPAVLAGRDVVGQARTGTGKTLAFALPILQQMDPARRLQALCLVPTRELAAQVVGEIRRIAEFTDLHAVPVYGGQRIQTQLHHLGKKPHFVVGTPGRVMDLMGRRALDIAELRFAVLDEVDRMLDIGFRDDIKWILGQINATHQTVVVSATIDGDVRRLVQRHTNDPLEVNVSRDEITVDEVDQCYMTVERHDKFRLLKMLLKQEDPQLAIIFTNTKAMARKLAKRLYDVGHKVAEIHSDLVQQKRERVMEKFRRHHIRLLIATDLAARGIDVTAITHIINYDIPADAQAYVHRIGRTARMGLAGKAITFVSGIEGKEITSVEILINKVVPERTVEGFKPSPPPERRDMAPRPKPVSRLQQSVHGGSPVTVPANAPRKTLGSRFKPSRRRRL